MPKNVKEAFIEQVLIRKELAENFSPAAKTEIIIKMDEIFYTNDLKKLYDQLMEEVYGDGGLKGY